MERNGASQVRDIDELTPDHGEELGEWSKASRQEDAVDPSHFAALDFTAGVEVSNRYRLDPHIPVDPCHSLPRVDWNAPHLDSPSGLYIRDDLGHGGMSCQSAPHTQDRRRREMGRPRKVLNHLCRVAIIGCQRTGRQIDDADKFDATHPKLIRYSERQSVDTNDDTGIAGSHPVLCRENLARAYGHDAWKRPAWKGTGFLCRAGSDDELCRFYDSGRFSTNTHLPAGKNPPNAGSLEKLCPRLKRILGQASGNAPTIPPAILMKLVVAVAETMQLSQQPSAGLGRLVDNSDARSMVCEQGRCRETCRTGSDDTYVDLH